MPFFDLDAGYFLRGIGQFWSQKAQLFQSAAYRRPNTVPYMESVTPADYSDVPWDQLSFEEKVQYVVLGVDEIELDILLEMLLTIGSGICSCQRERQYLLHHVVRRILVSGSETPQAIQSNFEHWVTFLTDLSFLEERYVTDVLDSFNESSSE